MRRFVFSSTAAVYGIPAEGLAREDTPTVPINPYGMSKLMVERILSDFDKAHGIRSIPLRYFNAAGADRDGKTGERHACETHVIPLALKGVAYKPIGASALLRRNLFIYGLGGVIVPFIGIKIIDMLVSVFF